MYDIKQAFFICTNIFLLVEIVLMVVQLLYCHSIVGCYVFNELLAIKLCVISGKAYL